MLLDEEDAGLMKRMSAITDLGLTLSSSLILGASGGCRQSYRGTPSAPSGRRGRASMLPSQQGQLSKMFVQTLLQDSWQILISKQHLDRKVKMRRFAATLWSLGDSRCGIKPCPCLWSLESAQCR